MRTLVFVLAATSGCAFERGEPTGVLTASFRAEYALAPERDAGDGWQSLVGPDEVRLDGAVLSVDSVELVAVVGPEDAESEATVATLSASSDADLLSPAELELICSGNCVLPPGRLVRALAAASLQIDGAIREASALAEVPLHVSLADLPALAAALDEPVDEDEPPGVTLALALALDASLFDGLELGDLERETDGSIHVSSEVNSDASASIASHLAATALAVTVSRTGE